MIVTLRNPSNRKKYVGKLALTLDVAYPVLEICMDSYRILDDDNDPILFPMYLFNIIDHSIPETWVTETGSDGDTYAHPPEFGVGFFEDYFDDDEKAQAIFWRYIFDQSF